MPSRLNALKARHSPSDKILFGNVQLECSTKRGAEVAAHSFQNFNERDDNPKCTVLLKLDFKNAFNSLNRETMLSHVYSNRPELYNYTHCACSKSSYLFYGSSVIMSEDGIQQNDPETPPLFAETIQTLVKQLESKINIWYLGDGNLADDYMVVLRDLKKIKDSEIGTNLRPELEHRIANFVFLGPTTSTQHNSIFTQFQKICAKINIKKKISHFRISNRRTLPKRVARRKN